MEVKIGYDLGNLKLSFESFIEKGMAIGWSQERGLEVVEETF